MTTIPIIRSYSELKDIQSFTERFEYLKLFGKVSDETFGLERYLNQRFYHSVEWRRIRDVVITRDNGCDLGMPDRPIYGAILIHHMNPVSKNDILQLDRRMTDPEYLICVSQNTHNAIHYGDISAVIGDLIERKPNDTCPWKT